MSWQLGKVLGAEKWGRWEWVDSRRLRLGCLCVLQCHEKGFWVFFQCISMIFRFFDDFERNWPLSTAFQVLWL